MQCKGHRLLNLIDLGAHLINLIVSPLTSYCILTALKPHFHPVSMNLIVIPFNEKDSHNGPVSTYGEFQFALA